jgi:hypothetical protein
VKVPYGRLRQDGAGCRVADGAGWAGGRDGRGGSAELAVRAGVAIRGRASSADLASSSASGLKVRRTTGAAALEVAENPLTCAAGDGRGLARSCEIEGRFVDLAGTGPAGRGRLGSSGEDEQVGVGGAEVELGFQLQAA